MSVRVSGVVITVLYPSRIRIGSWYEAVHDSTSDFMTEQTL